MRIGVVTARLAIETGSVSFASENVVGTLAGASSGVVVLGGHLDSVPEGPGANDNASGSAVSLELARMLASNPPGYTVRIILFGAEEDGLEGSFYYVSQLSARERSEIIAMVNLDMVGVGTRLSLFGTARLRQMASEAATGRGLSARSVGEGGGGSDHAPFQRAGIPALFFYWGDDPNYHLPTDLPQYVQPALLEHTGALALALLDRLKTER
jgi:aminopeptidase YwaD